jgi:O-antigen ligase
MRALVVVLLGAEIASALFTFSRAGDLALVIVVPVVVVFLARHCGLSWSRLLRGLAALAVVGATTVVLVEPLQRTADDFWQRAKSSFDLQRPLPRRCLICPGVGDIAISMRLDFWRVAVQMAADHPLVGIGQERFPDLFPAYSHALLPADRVRLLDRYRIESPHNVYLAIAAGSGIPALVAYLLVVLGAMCVILKAATATASRITRAALVCIVIATVGHLVTDAFMTADLTGTWLLWLLLGTGVALATRQRETAAEAQPGTRAKSEASW